MPDIIGWTGTHFSVVVGVFGGLYFIYKVAAGALMSSASLSMTIDRHPGDDENSHDLLSVTLLIERNENWSIRLNGAQVRLTQCWQNGTNKKCNDVKADTASISVTPYILNDYRDKNSEWRQRTEADDKLDKDGRLSMAPKEKASFSTVMSVPRGSVCTLEATVDYRQWNWIPSWSRGVLVASAVSLPRAKTVPADQPGTIKAPDYSITA